MPASNQPADQKKVVLELLRGARALIDEPGRWSRLALCRDDKGNRVAIGSNNIHSYCIYGAVLATSKNTGSSRGTFRTAINVLNKLCRIIYDKGIRKYGSEQDLSEFLCFPISYTNDGLIKNHAEAKRLLDAAIKSLDKKHDVPASTTASQKAQTTEPEVAGQTAGEMPAPAAATPAQQPAGAIPEPAAATPAQQPASVIPDPAVATPAQQPTGAIPDPAAATPAQQPASAIPDPAAATPAQQPAALDDAQQNEEGQGLKISLTDSGDEMPVKSASAEDNEPPPPMGEGLSLADTSTGTDIAPQPASDSAPAASIETGSPAPATEEHPQMNAPEQNEPTRSEAVTMVGDDSTKTSTVVDISHEPVLHKDAEQKENEDLDQVIDMDFDMPEDDKK